MNPGRRLLLLVGTAAATQLLMMAAGLAGPAGFFVNLLIPLPVALAVMLGGAGVGLGAVALTAGGCLAIGSPEVAASYLLQFAVGSLLLPLLLRRGWSWGRALAATVAVAAALAAVAVVGYTAWRGISLQGTVDTYIQNEIGRALAMYQGENLEPGTLEEFKKVAEQTGAFLRSAYPGLAVVAIGFVQGLTLLFLAVVARGRYRLPGPSFRQWRIPEWLIWVLIAAGFGMVLPDKATHGVALNLLVVLLPVYFLQGLAIVNFFFARKGISPLARLIGYLLITILNPLPLIVTGIGVFDLWADFRRPRIKKT